MATEKFMDASTAYITYQDSLLLLECPCEFPARVIPHEFGWWINVPLDDEFFIMYFWEMKKLGYSRAFRELLALARKKGCWWINLDCDGGEIKELQEIEWEY